MPRTNNLHKVDAKRQELADRLNVSEESILSRKEAAAILGYQTHKTLGRRGDDAPGFYLADGVGPKGYALYLRSEVELWRDDPRAWGKAKDRGETGHPMAWPPARVVQPAPPGTRVALEQAMEWRNRGKDIPPEDRAYIEAVLGNRVHAFDLPAPPSPGDPIPQKSKRRDKA